MESLIKEALRQIRSKLAPPRYEDKDEQVTPEEFGKGGLLV